MTELDNNLPIFPLSGAILLPDSNLPLNIFEKKYIEMVDYSLSHNKTIGMIQTMEKDAKLYKIGCCGKITSFHTTNDGRYLINLYGVKLFRTVREIDSKKMFRIFKVEFDKKNKDKFDTDEAKFDKSLLLNKFKLFINKTNLQTSLSSIESINAKDLVKVLAMSCPFSVSEKQLLLESEDNNILADKLIVLFDFYNSHYDHKKTVN